MIVLDEMEEGKIIVSVKKIAFLLMILTVLSKMLGFLRDVTLSYFYGASSISDAYIISVTITSILFSLLITGVASGYIPLFTEIESGFDEQRTKDFTNNLITICMIISTVLIICGFLFANPLVKLFALGFDEETRKAAVLFTRVGLIGFYFTTLTQIYTSYLQLHQKFAITAIIGIPFNCIIISSIIISSQTSIYVLAIGTVIAAFAQLLFLIPSLRNTHYSYAPIVNFKDKHIKQMAFFVFPIMIGMSVDHINSMVDKTLASRIVEGGISALTYASRFNDFVIGVFVISFITVLFPLLSKMAVDQSTEDIKSSIKEVLTSVMLLVIPASVGMMVLAEPIIKLFFGRGHFNDQAILLTSNAMFYYSIGMIGYGTREILIRTFYSLQDMKTPMYNASIAVFLNIILNLILSRYMGIGGLALATSISALVSTGLLFFSLRRKIGAFGLKSIGWSLGKIAIASSVMGVVIYVLNNNQLLSGLTAVFRMGTIIIVGFIVYFVIIRLLKVEESKVITAFIWKKGSQ